MRIPLDRAGIDIAADALSKVVADDSQGYPQFLQLWGSALWERASERDQHQIDSGDIDQIAPEMQREREEVYLSRFAAWRNEDRESLAEIAHRLLREGWMERSQLEELVKETFTSQDRNDEEYGWANC